MAIAACSPTSTWSRDSSSELEQHPRKHEEDTLNECTFGTTEELRPKHGQSGSYVSADSRVVQKSASGKFAAGRQSSDRPKSPSRSALQLPESMRSQGSPFRCPQTGVSGQCNSENLFICRNEREKMREDAEFGFRRAVTLRATNVNLPVLGQALLRWDPVCTTPHMVVRLSTQAFH
jgi:hypothetical protein